jgi:hypothetical protein
VAKFFPYPARQEGRFLMVRNLNNTGRFSNPRKDNRMTSGPALASPPQKLWPSAFQIAARARAATPEGRAHLEKMRENSLRVRQSKKLSATPI